MRWAVRRSLLEIIFTACWWPQERRHCTFLLEMSKPHTYQNRICSVCSIQHKIISWKGDVALQDGLEIGRESCDYSCHATRPDSASLLYQCGLWPNSVNVTGILWYSFCWKQDKKVFKFYLKQNFNMNVQRYEMVLHFPIWHLILTHGNILHFLIPNPLSLAEQRGKNDIPISVRVLCWRGQVKVFIATMDWIVSPSKFTYWSPNFQCDCIYR